MSAFVFVKKHLIEKGWSCDTKYCAETADGKRYLHRITPKEKSSSRYDMFRMQQRCAELRIPMCKPLEIGECEEGIYIKMNPMTFGSDLKTTVKKPCPALIKITAARL